MGGIPVKPRGGKEAPPFACGNPRATHDSSLFQARVTHTQHEKTADQDCPEKARPVKQNGRWHYLGGPRPVAVLKLVLPNGLYGSVQFLRRNDQTPPGTGFR